MERCADACGRPSGMARAAQRLIFIAGGRAHGTTAMETLPEIDFQGLEPRGDLRAKIVEKIAHLEKLYGRMTACRVVVKGPGGHHRTGGHYDVNIRIALPDGREVDVSRAADPDERFQDVWFALGDAFRRADRQLEDAVREIRGDVKHHEAAPTGVVKSLSPADGFGLLESVDGREIYFHRNSVAEPGFGSLKVGERVEFLEEDGAKGPQARRVKPLRDTAPS